MKVAISLLLVFCFFTAVTQQKNTATSASNSDSDTIHWNKDIKLTWGDFQGGSDSTSLGGASTSSGFLTKSRYTSKSTISVIITAVFYKQKSWVKSNSNDRYGLSHEQGHFDITEVFARKANTAFKKYKYNKARVNKDIDSIVNFYFNEMSKTEDLYDKETNHSLNKAKQEEWNKKISAWLKKYPA